MAGSAILKRTPLFAEHQKLGARLIDFGGWEMPVQYTGIVEEHLAVRKAAGLFDIAHMGEVEVSGPGASAFLDRVLTNDLSKLNVGHGQYNLMCNERGGVVDDLYCYRLGERNFLLIINASRIDADLNWFQQQLAAEGPAPAFELVNRSDALGALAVQGPGVAEFIDAWFALHQSASPGTVLSALKKNQLAGRDFAGSGSFIARTGYTGEDGFEIVAPSSSLPDLWNSLLRSGEKAGIKPAGLGARDTLRTEVCYPLYGHELDEETSPLEAGLGRFVVLEKNSFVGGEALRRQKEQGVRRRCVAFKMTSRSAPPRPGYSIYGQGGGPEVLGRVVSGTQSPSLGIGIGMGYVPPEASSPGVPIEIEVRGNRAPAVIVAKPIYRKAGA